MYSTGCSPDTGCAKAAGAGLNGAVISDVALGKRGVRFKSYATAAAEPKVATNTLTLTPIAVCFFIVDMTQEPFLLCAQRR